MINTLKHGVLFPKVLAIVICSTSHKMFSTGYNCQFMKDKSMSEQEINPNLYILGAIGIYIAYIYIYTSTQIINLLAPIHLVETCQKKNKNDETPNE